MPLPLTDEQVMAVVNALLKPPPEKKKTMTCPRCFDPMFYDPVNAAQHCANADCDFPYVITDTVGFTHGHIKLREMLITGVHKLPTIFDFYKRGIEDTQ